MEVAYMTKEEAARHLRISERTLDRLVAEGKVPSARPSPRRVVFRQQDLDEYMLKLFRDSVR